MLLRMEGGGGESSSVCVSPPFSSSFFQGKLKSRTADSEKDQFHGAFSTLAAFNMVILSLVQPLKLTTRNVLFTGKYYEDHVQILT